MADAAAALAEFDIPAEVRVVSAHRTPEASTLWGVGLGPGDPELVTVKAARVIGEADVVAYHTVNAIASDRE